MAYAIYFLKIELMSEHFQLDQTERKQSKRMAHFISLFHSEAFLRCRLSSILPAQDLRYLRLMQCYREKDRDVADAAIKSILNHLWYVTQEMVVFSLFDFELPADLRRDIAQKLMSFPRLKNFVSGKPKFPVDQLKKEEPINISTALLSCVGERSWLFFNLLQSFDESVDWMFLQLSAGIKG